MNNIENRKALLAQRKERFLQTIHKVGLTTLIGFSGLSANAENNVGTNLSQLNADNNITTNVTQNNDNEKVTIYTKTYSLESGAPIEMPKKLGDGRKAYYSSYLNNGNGGIVVNQYSISDNEAFLHAKRTNDTKCASCSEAITSFANKATLFKYNKEIKTLKDVEECLNSFSNTSKKKEKYIYDNLYSIAGENGLTSAIEVIKQVENLNKDNMNSVSHEEFHAENGQYMKKIEEGEILLSPGGMYMVRMADELQAQIRSGDITPTTEGLSKFFKEFGTDYKNQYLENIDNDASYKRLFAAGLQEQSCEKKTIASVNNILIPINASFVEAKDKNGNTYSVNAMETKDAIVFMGNFNDGEIREVTLENGKKIHLNCLYNADGSIQLDENGNKIAATTTQENGDFVLSFNGTHLTTASMDKTLEETLPHILRNLDEEQKNNVIEALNKYCKQDALIADKTAIADYDIEKLHKETSKEDVEYIISNRKNNLQKQNGNQEDLQSISKEAKTLVLQPQDFCR